MPYLHCIVNKCSIPPSEKFPYFFSALPRSGAALSRRALLSSPLHTSMLTKRFYYSDPNASRAAIIASLVLLFLCLAIGLWRVIMILRQREDRSSQAKINTNPDYWMLASSSIPPAAYGYEMNSGRPVGPYAAPAAVHYNSRQQPHWNDVNQLNPNGGSRSSRAGHPRGSRQTHDLSRARDGSSCP
jgi:hypothetical protein